VSEPLAADLRKSATPRRNVIVRDPFVDPRTYLSMSACVIVEGDDDNGRATPKRPRPGTEEVSLDAP